MHCLNCCEVFEEYADAKMHWAEYGHTIEGLDPTQLRFETEEEAREYADRYKGSMAEAMDVFYEKSNR